jgi:hypothetical protein
MNEVLEHTCWRGLEMDHPSDWEMALASPPNKPAQCTFADRRYERLKVQWRALTLKPNLEKMVRDRLTRDGKTGAAVLTGQPAPWQGVLQESERGAVAHAGGYFEPGRMLVEVVMIWPGRRDRGLENRILSSIRVADPAQGSRRWQAMGIKMSLSREFDLTAFECAAGRTAFTFGRKNEKRGPMLTVKRMGVPKYWLNMPLEDWLESQLAAGDRVLAKNRTTFNGHNAAKVLSEKRGRAWDRLRGYRPVRLDVSWRCPTEERVYHVVLAARAKGEDPELPDHVKIECCRPYHL